MLRFLLLLAAAAVALCSAIGTLPPYESTHALVARQASNAPIAVTKNGTYQGRHVPEYNQDFFLGIPYAQPPVGQLRLRNPVSLNSSFTGIRMATEYSVDCINYGVYARNPPTNHLLMLGCRLVSSMQTTWAAKIVFTSLS